MSTSPASKPPDELPVVLSQQRVSSTLRHPAWELLTTFCRRHGLLTQTCEGKGNGFGGRRTKRSGWAW